MLRPAILNVLETRLRSRASHQLAPSQDKIGKIYRGYSMFAENVRKSLRIFPPIAEFFWIQLPRAAIPILNML